MHPSIRILSRIEPKNPLLVAAWPGMGNVAYSAAVYLKESLDVQKVAEIEPSDIFYQTGVQINDGAVTIPELPKSEFFYYKNPDSPNDLIIFLGESQPVMEKEYELAWRVVETARYFGVKEIITFAATPVNINHHQEPGVWGVSTDPMMIKKLPIYGIKVMNGGHIGGLNGLLLGVGKEKGIKGSCFLGEIPFYTVKIENPRSSLAVLRVFIRYTGISFELDGLLQMVKFVEEEIDRISKTTKKNLFGEKSAEIQNGDEDHPGKGFGGKVPKEVRDRIEYMFAAASEDISRAGELKEELDRWGLFPEYEDRFLDLFGKRNL